MGANLIDQLKQVEDFRTKDGRRHPLWLVLLFVTMGTMNGDVGYRGWGDFVKRHSRVLIKKFGIQKHGVPSYSTIRRVVMGVEFDKLAEKFNDWAKNYVEIEESEWCALDGKSIKGANLIDQLKQVEDFRTKDGRRHPLWLVLLFVTMGTMNGYVGYRGWGDFVKRHSRVLIKKFGIQKHGVPSYSTIRRVVMGVEFDKLAEKFNDWAKNYVEIEESEWCALDGKSV
ncbi:transposase family protein [Nostoc punctiforme UO1]|uniref:transposase family protein n=1 Tax=Nostoc punctiforme TaxID=272131 RepID=UPI003094A891